MSEVERLEERVGSGFLESKIDLAQERTWAVLREICSHMQPGMTEDEAYRLALGLIVRHGASRNWHKPKIRFGVNTTKGFSELSVPGVVLQPTDIFFLDLGLVFDGFEGDAGATVAVGANPEHLRIIEDSKAIFSLVAKEWKESGKSGVELYQFAEKLANDRGWELNSDGASGHRIADFPHQLYYKGDLRDFGGKPLSHRWILEIQLRSRDGSFGAFYEDVLRG